MFGVKLVSNYKAVGDVFTPTCLGRQGELIENYDFMCGTTGWSEFTDAGGGSFEYNSNKHLVHIEADGGYYGFKPNRTFEAGTYKVKCKVTNIVGKAKIAVKYDDNTWAEVIPFDNGSGKYKTTINFPKKVKYFTISGDEGGSGNHFAFDLHFC